MIDELSSIKLSLSLKSRLSILLLAIFFLSTLPSIVVFSRELDLCIMGPKYDNLSLIIHALTETCALIYSIVHSFFRLSMVFFKSLFQDQRLNVSIHFFSCFFKVQLLHPQRSQGNHFLDSSNLCYLYHGIWILSYPLVKYVFI